VEWQRILHLNFVSKKERWNKKKHLVSHVSECENEAYARREEKGGFVLHKRYKLKFFMIMALRWLLL
jgi:hypothetical protein